MDEEYIVGVSAEDSLAGHTITVLRDYRPGVPSFVEFLEVTCRLGCVHDSGPILTNRRLYQNSFHSFQLLGSYYNQQRRLRDECDIEQEIHNM